MNPQPDILLPNADLLFEGQCAGTGDAARADFPILGRQVYGKPLVYLDNAATTQKPKCVIDAITREYCEVNANVHRGVHFLSQKATELHEEARETVRRFLNAREREEIIFTRGTTESLNLVASSYGEAFLKEGDEVILSTMEHHSNIVPWQMLRDRKGIVIKVIPIDDEGRLLLDEYERLFTDRTRLVCVTHVSNVLGTVNPVAEMARTAHAHGCHILVDGAQSVPHFPVDVQELDCDFLTFSGHKIYGPTGIGVLVGAAHHAEEHGKQPHVARHGAQPRRCKGRRNEPENADRRKANDKSNDEFDALRGIEKHFARRSGCVAQHNAHGNGEKVCVRQLLGIVTQQACQAFQPLFFAHHHQLVAKL